MEKLTSCLLGLEVFMKAPSRALVQGLTHRLALGQGPGLGLGQALAPGPKRAGSVKSKTVKKEKGRRRQILVE